VPALAQGNNLAAFYEQPVLVLDPGMHTAMIRRVDVDRAGQLAVTGSDDKTIRLWRLGAKPELVNTIRVASGPGNVGKIFQVAMSPDGALVAAGGWARYTDLDQQDQIYLFGRDGTLVKRIDRLPTTVVQLAFSSDGRYLATGLFGTHGIRVYDREKGWAEAFRDTDYGHSVHGLDFSADGQLATASYDGHIRLYDAGFKRIAKQQRTSGDKPFNIAFRPDGRRLAVGSNDTTAVALVDVASLDPLPAPDLKGIDTWSLASITWSRDGGTLFAGGRFNVNGQHPVLAWADGGAGQRRSLFAGNLSTILSLKALPAGELLVSAYDPHLALLGADGAPRWTQTSPNFDAREQTSNLSVSADGTVVEFGYAYGGKSPFRFDLARLQLSADPPADVALVRPRQSGLAIANWAGFERPTFDGKELPFDQNELSRSLAIHPAGDRFVLGSEWALRAFDAKGERLWRRDAPSIVWAVNITGDGRMAVAAYGDGTIRWHRMDDGRELLAFYPLADRSNWVAWTPEGFYGATPGAFRVLKWHVNRGWDQAAEAYPGVSQFQHLRRPEALALVLQEMETGPSAWLDDMRKAAREIPAADQLEVGPGARLHVLSVGVSKYGDKAQPSAPRLRGQGCPGCDLGADSTPSQGSYADVSSQELKDTSAPASACSRRSTTMTANMATRAHGRDVAVLMFSGHGALIEGEYYLLPTTSTRAHRRRSPRQRSRSARCASGWTKLGESGLRAGAARCLPIWCGDCQRERVGGRDGVPVAHGFNGPRQRIGARPHRTPTNSPTRVRNGERCLHQGAIEGIRQGC
jgi:WD40 repeat protein